MSKKKKRGPLRLRFARVQPDEPPDEPLPDIRWADRSEQPFQEVAEVLGTTTELVMGVRTGAGTMTALYTPDYDRGDKTVWAAQLQRNHVTGVLELVSTEPQPGMYEELLGDLERDLHRKLGPPEP